MNEATTISPMKVTFKTPTLVETLKEMEEKCKNCNPLSIIDCVARCPIWEHKNELRQLGRRLQNSSFIEQLLNTLKNKRRLEILDIISKTPQTLNGVQRELKKKGHLHSQKIIEEEYLVPLLKTELVKEEIGRYSATAFGRRVNELARNLRTIENSLPAHSECYEEKLLMALIENPKKFEDIERIVPTKSVARVLSRLQKLGLVETSKEKDYVFFFRTQRDPEKEVLSPTEKKTLENIPAEGISARKLAKNTGISLRRVYKYLRRLKGKKLVFVRRKPKTYTLTSEGLNMALAIQGICSLVSEASTTILFLMEKEAFETQTAKTSRTETLRSNN
ncbi:MAG: hypothetical protein QXJ02_05365 [Candidatus Bathyarchaeia archaeon]